MRADDRAASAGRAPNAGSAGLAGVTAEPGVAKPDPILVVDDVVRRFGGLTAVDIAHLEIPRGCVTALIGPNGAGKTTLFNLLTGFDRPDSGTATFDGAPLFDGAHHRMAAHRTARRGMVRTFQLPRALSRLSVLDNMRLGAPRQRGENFWWGFVPRAWRAQEREVTRRADELLARFALQDWRDEFAGTLSGGQRKLLEMARALMVGPRMLMLDEPMAGVNPALTRSLLRHVRRLREEGMTVLFVEHDMEVVRDVSDWVVVMASGGVIAEGSPERVMADRRVIDAYLGTGGSAGRGCGGGTGNRAAPMSAPVLPPPPVLSVAGLVAGYLPGLDILRGVDLLVRDGELVGVIGPNGAGKSTLLKALFGLVRVSAGAVALRGEEITNRAPHTLVGRGIGYVPQSGNVFASLTVEENLELGTFLRPRRFRERLDAVGGLFPTVVQRRRQRAGSLSGGERQQVAIARALMPEPAVLLLDEVSAGLSPALQDEVFRRVRQIGDAGVAVVMVEQNARQCLRICDRGYVLDQGRNAYTGTGAELAADPRIVELYLGGLARQDDPAGPRRATGQGATLPET